MNLLEDIAKCREYHVQLACQSSDKEVVFANDDVIGKLDALSELAEAWLDGQLGSLRVLTTKRIELELKQCEDMLRTPEPRDSYVRHWITKRKNLLLLQKLIVAWHGDSLHDVKFAVSIQE